MRPLDSHQSREFSERGFLLRRGAATPELLEQLRAATWHDLRERVEPFELEAEVCYPGAPASIDAPGGQTIRRLLLAFARGGPFQEWALQPSVLRDLRQLFGDDALHLVQSHHNCVMTKQPRFSSLTAWHKDVRYWRFDDNRLINTWLALYDETPDNGCLRVLPGSHRWRPESGLLDDAQFLREDTPEGRAWIERAENVSLKAGDALYFDAGIFHAAGHNRSEQPKMSVVFTYHDGRTHPVADSKSTAFPEIIC